MRYKILFPIFFWLVTHLYTGEEIRVELTTACTLSPIYIGALQATDTSFSPDYLQQLEAILTYDFHYNGTTKVCPRTEEKDKLLTAKSIDLVTGKALGIPYVLSWHVTRDKLFVTVRDLVRENARSFTDITLSGDLKRDRRHIHKLADSIYQMLFHQEGIAHSRILFAYQPKVGTDKEWISEIWECDWDGANARQVTFEQSYALTPVLLPPSATYSNDHFLYVSYKTGIPKIFIGSLAEKTGKPLVSLRGHQLLPCISLKRDKIAFISDVSGRSDLFLQPLNPQTGETGKPVQLYAFPRSTQSSPTFSPDGTKIVFASDKDGGVRLYLVPATPSTKRPEAVLLTKRNRENICPTWSPDGTKLAYSAKVNGVKQIWIYDFAKQEEIQLTAGLGNKENPAWAPNSKHIVFNSTDDNSTDLYIVNLNQPEAVKISRGAGRKHYPTWGNR